MRPLSPSSLPVFVLAAAGLALAVSPVAWLVNTWVDPSYDSFGGYVYVVVACLFLWSSTSRLGTPSSTASRRLALTLLASTALIRLTGRLLAVNFLGAMALVVDFYALGLLAGLGRRARAVSPGWLALAFAYSLPLEHLLQRVVGFSLQRLSAGSACALLDLSFGDTACLGTRIILAGRDVQVDLPCSGARGLIQLLLFFTLVAALKRPKFKAALAGFAITLMAGFVANTVRLSLIAFGLAWPTQVFGVNVMAEPWHDLIGLLALALGALPIMAWVILAPTKRHDVTYPDDVAAFTPRPKAAWSTALAFAAFAGVALVVPSRPFDVSPLNHAPILPEMLADQSKEPLDLSPKELGYFTEYGGGAAKARYGQSTLVLVSTTSPLRHLHTPDECLLGSGHEVHFVGTEYARMPSAVYQSIAPDGKVYRVAVTYVSNDGRVATSISEVVWLWLSGKGSRWTALERISEWQATGWQRRLFDDAVARSFDIPNAYEEPETLSRGSI